MFAGQGQRSTSRWKVGLAKAGRPSLRSLRSLRVALSVAAGLLAIIVGPASTLAGDLDFRLNRGNVLIDGNTADGFQPNNGRFRDFVTQLGFVLAPRMASPAETLGHDGFHVGAMWSGSFVSSDQPYWQVTERGQRGAAPGMLSTLQLDLRKGLPMSFEIGANLMWLVESQVFAPGLEVRWAFQEGYRYVPDFSIRAAANHLVGNRDLSLTTMAAEFMLSKNFGVGGAVNLAPYVGWALIFMHSSSRVIDPTPEDGEDLLNNFVFDDPEFGEQINHKLTAGLRMLYHVLNISVQGEFQLLDDYETGGEGVLTVTTKLGLDY